LARNWRELLENHHVSVGWPAAFQARSTVIEESRFPSKNRREHIVKSAERTAQTVQSLCNGGPFINCSTSFYAANGSAAYRRGDKRILNIECVIASASPSSNCSAATVAWFRAPLGHPSGLPLCPGLIVI
jgi:hypothetical protein